MNTIEEIKNSYDLALPIASGWVDARNLHGHLSPGRDFPTWFRSRCREYEFTQGIDFHEYLDSPKRGNQVSHGGDRKSKNYKLTLSMAKELCMVERSEIGRAVRKYFIAAEEELKRQQEAARLPRTTPAQEMVQTLQQLLELGITPESATQIYLATLDRGRRGRMSLPSDPCADITAMDSILAVMATDQSYHVGDIIKLLPPRHPALWKKSEFSALSAIGLLLQKAVRLGKLHKTPGRRPLYSIPEAA